jgi:hypothetical protein
MKKEFWKYRDRGTLIGTALLKKKIPQYRDSGIFLKYRFQAWGKIALDPKIWAI